MHNLTLCLYSKDENVIFSGLQTLNLIITLISKEKSIKIEEDFRNSRLEQLHFYKKISSYIKNILIYLCVLIGLIIEEFFCLNRIWTVIQNLNPPSPVGSISEIVTVSTADMICYRTLLYTFKYWGTNFLFTCYLNNNKCINFVKTKMLL